MRRRPGCPTLIGTAVFIGLAGLAFLMAGMFLVRWRQGRAWQQLAPPQVRIALPANGAEFGVGSFVGAHASVAFLPDAPVRSLEWSLDGALLATESVEPAAGVTRLSPGLEFLVPASGGHLLSLRATDVNGSIGQSLPVFFVGVEKGGDAYALAEGDGTTLEDLAAEIGADPTALHALNPDLGEAPLAAGATVKVPIPPEVGPETAPAAPAAAGPAPAAPPNPPLLQPPQLWNGLVGFLAPKLPQPATNFEAQLQDCKVKTSWVDHADDETGFQVWQTTPGGASLLVATLPPSPGGPMTHELVAPGPGIFAYWVVTHNAVGGQPSELAIVTVGTGCPSSGPQQLSVEVRDIHLGVPAERVYCYVSFENLPERRLPDHDGDFISVQGGHGDLAPWPHMFAVPLPTDGSLDLQGECWGWSGKTLSKLGAFASALPASTWDGSDQVLGGGPLEITIGVLAKSASDPADATYTSGPALPVPYALSEKELDQEPRVRELSWKWDGKREDIDGFIIFINGAEVWGAAYFPPDGYRTTVKLDQGCGQNLKWQVAAVSKSTLSALSAPLPVGVAPCKTVVQVRYQSIELQCAAEGSSNCQTEKGLANYSLCDDLDGYYELSVNDETRPFFGGDFFVPIRCGLYPLNQLGAWYVDNGVYPSADSFILPADAEPIDLRLRAAFWDYDSTSGDDRITAISHNIWYPSLESARSSLHADDTANGCLWTSDENFEYNGTARASVTYTLEIFPNACRDAP